MSGIKTNVRSTADNWRDTLEALEDIRMGRVIDGDKVHAWLKSWGTGNELPMPLENGCD